MIPPYFFVHVRFHDRFVGYRITNTSGGEDVLYYRLHEYIVLFQQEREEQRDATYQEDFKVKARANIVCKNRTFSNIFQFTFNA